MRFSTPAALVELRRLLLAGPLDGVPVATSMPREVPSTFVRVERIGGRPESAITDAPRVIIHIYSESGVDAERIATLVLDYLERGGWSHTRTESGHLLRGWRTESVMPLLDPDRPDRHRWQVIGALRISRLRRATL